MNLADFIKSFRNEDSPFGDFAKDFVTSKIKAITYNGIKKKLIQYGICELALDVFEEIVLLYNSKEKL